MPTSSPIFDPNWRQRLAMHFISKSKCIERLYNLAISGVSNSPVVRRVESELALHEQNIKEALKAQHRTVQEYAIWLFTTAAGGAHLGAIATLDIDALLSIEEVDIEFQKYDTPELHALHLRAVYSDSRTSFYGLDP